MPMALLCPCTPVSFLVRFCCTGRVVYLESLQAMSKELDELQLSLKTSSMLQSIPDEMPRGTLFFPIPPPHAMLPLPPVRGEPFTPTLHKQ